jgi:hypothetical protein
MVNVTCIVSGGQTGADRGGLDAAIALQIDHGGWCPAGRRAEDGPIPSLYGLRETLSSNYAVRTQLNVRDSDGTVVFTLGAACRGSALTIECARKLSRPVLHIDLSPHCPGSAAHPGGARAIDLPPHCPGSAAHPGGARVIDLHEAFPPSLARRPLVPQGRIEMRPNTVADVAARIAAWCAAQNVSVLNVAGSRESGAPGMASAVLRILVRALTPRSGEHGTRL